MKNITAKQQRILDYIAEFSATQGYPPAVRDICAGVGLSSPSTVHAHIKALRDLGFLNKEDHKTRALTLHGASATQQVPILGAVTAGVPILAVEQIEGYVPYDKTGKYGDFFALRIKGLSMRDAGILDGDLIIIRKQEYARSGEIVVALLDDEATCKRLRLTGSELWLMPENPDYEPIDGTDSTILGVVVAVYRHYMV